MVENMKSRLFEKREGIMKNLSIKVYSTYTGI